MTAEGSHEFEAERRGRLDALLSEWVADVSRARLAHLIREGAVRVNGVAIVKPATKLRVGDRVVVVIPPPVDDEARPENLPIDIVYEDADVAVINKAPGMVVHPSAGHASGTLVNALLHHLDGLSGIGGVSRPGIVHRLDKGTSGLLVVAKNDRAHKGLAAQFADHSAGRVYVALVYGQPTEDSGTIETLLARHPTDRIRWASTDREVGKRAVTHWRVLARAGSVSLLSCELETGRTHQIRVHLTEIGHPLLGDNLYKRRHTRPPASIRERVVDGRPLLHARALRFQHPVTDEPKQFEAAPAEDFAAILDTLELTDRIP